MASQTHVPLDIHTASKLRELAQLNIDSRDGFDYAAERIDDAAPQIASQFRTLSDERAMFAEQLEALLVNNGEDAPEEGSWAASMHRTWMNIRDMLSAEPDIRAIVAEAERGEDVIKQAYQEAAGAVSGPSAALVRDQQQSIIRAHDLVRDLRDSMTQE